jgi:hypothetical protein
MTRPSKLVVNCETGEQTIIELTDEEIAQMETQAAEQAAQEAEQEAQAAIAAAAKASAESKLTALGLTPEEIAALSK